MAFDFMLLQLVLCWCGRRATATLLAPVIVEAHVVIRIRASSKHGRASMALELER